jgi:hypothetical protein
MHAGIGEAAYDYTIYVNTSVAAQGSGGLIPEVLYCSQLYTIIPLLPLKEYIQLNSREHLCMYCNNKTPSPR